MCGLGDKMSELNEIQIKFSGTNLNLSVENDRLKLTNKKCSWEQAHIGTVDPDGFINTQLKQSEHSMDVLFRYENKSTISIHNKRGKVLALNGNDRLEWIADPLELYMFEVSN
jgi:hypothetical protein